MLFLHSSTQCRENKAKFFQKAGQSPAEFLSLHVREQWGDIPEEDLQENEYSLERGFRLLSSYRTKASETIWVVTESDRSVTTLLLPSEY